MFSCLGNIRRNIIPIFWLFSSTLAVTFFFTSQSAAASSQPDSDPWNASQTIDAATLARELSQPKQTQPTILYVGVRTLFNGGHIPGAIFYGSASTAQGLADIKKWAESMPRDINLVIYCGCCPLERCPNIRPAFSTLRELGFTKLRVLVLPTSFATDWAEKGFPVEKLHP